MRWETPPTIWNGTDSAGSSRRPLSYLRQPQLADRPAASSGASCPDGFLRCLTLRRSGTAPFPSIAQNLLGIPNRAVEFWGNHSEFHPASALDSLEEDNAASRPPLRKSMSRS